MARRGAFWLVAPAVYLMAYGSWRVSRALLRKPNAATD
jgi:hypothetical protein